MRQTQSQPKKITTYQALVLLGLQEEFLSPGSPSSVNTTSGFLNKILTLIPKWRDRAGYVISIPSESSGSASTLTEELPRTAREVDRFVGALRNKQPLPWNGRIGEFHESIQKVVDPKADIIMTAPYGTISTSLSFMRSMYTQVITKIFICGCVTDSSVYTLLLDAAKKGWDVVLIEDCLGYPEKDKRKHKLAMKYMREKLCVDTISSKEIFADLDEPTEQRMSEKELGDLLDTLLAAKNKGKGKEKLVAEKKDESKPKPDEQTVKAEAMDLQPEQTVKTDAMDLQPEQMVKADAMDLQPEQTVKPDAMDLQPEQTVKAEAMDLQPEQTFKAEAMDLHPEPTTTSSPASMLAPPVISRKRSSEVIMASSNEEASTRSTSRSRIASNIPQ
jgi:nicotinamidase-related amidase